MATKNANAALRLWLLAQTDVAALVSTRIYGRSTPEGFASLDPSASIVLDRAGGDSDPGMPIQETLFGIRCYGASDAGAEAVYMVLRNAMRRMNSNTITGGGITYVLCSAIEEAPSVPSLDPDTEWPVVISQWRVLIK